MEVVLAAAGTGQIAPSEGAALAGLVEAYARIMNVAELARLDHLEKELRGLRP
jgi:hypothetical protein